MLPNRPTGARPEGALETTIELLTRAQAGDAASIDALFERCVPPLRRWARGRLPAYARDLENTEDLVHDAVLNTLHRLREFHPRHQGALQAYLRQAVVNRIRDEIRRVLRRPVRLELDEDHAAMGPLPDVQAMVRERFERYEAALDRLRPIDRELIIARLELQQSYEEIAVACQKPTASAARIAVMRALAHLVEKMNDAA